MSNNAPDFTACPHWGKGGRYIADDRGQRLPAIAAAQDSARLGPPLPPAQSDPVTAAPPLKPTKKGR